MNAAEGKAAAFDLSDSVQHHAYLWLVSGNAVGTLLAALLLWPRLNESIEPFAYGRWGPLHLNWMLYGWGSLPVIGLLLAFYLRNATRRERVLARVALAGWSVALAVGAISWLGGNASGKLFLDWHEGARGLLPGAMTVLWLTLAAGWSARWETATPRSRFLGGVLLSGLAAVPIVYFLSTARTQYPPVNPDSGGATGTSLLGSTLAIVLLAGLVPIFLKIAPRARSVRNRWYWGAWAISAAAFALSGHGHESHHRPGQIAALALLLVWPPVAWIHFGQFAWKRAAVRWLAAAWVWWTLLVASGFLIFLPGWSEAAKFTHLLVAHAHLAMAAFLTCFNVALLKQCGREGRERSGQFWSWQGFCALHLGSLVALGLWEGRHLADLYTGGGQADLFYAVRLVAGVGMTGVSCVWLWESWT